MVSRGRVVAALVCIAVGVVAGVAAGKRPALRMPDLAHWAVHAVGGHPVASNSPASLPHYSRPPTTVKEALARVTSGMTGTQVRAALGPPQRTTSHIAFRFALVPPSVMHHDTDWSYRIKGHTLWVLFEDGRVCGAGY